MLPHLHDSLSFFLDNLGGFIKPEECHQKSSTAKDLRLIFDDRTMPDPEKSTFVALVRKQRFAQFFPIKTIYKSISSYTTTCQRISSWVATVVNNHNWKNGNLHSFEHHSHPALFSSWLLSDLLKWCRGQWSVLFSSNSIGSMDLRQTQFSITKKAKSIFFSFGITIRYDSLKMTEPLLDFVFWIWQVIWLCNCVIWCLKSLLGAFHKQCGQILTNFLDRSPLWSGVEK